MKSKKIIKKNRSGKVYLVGAGLGAWDLMTIRAMNCLKKADVIFHDRLISSQLLQHAAPQAKLIYVGKKASFHTLPQDEIEDRLVEEAKKGKVVVRLKGGDPYIFGRGGEEAERLVAEKIEFEVIPGISSAFAAPLFGGIPLTHRQYSASMTVVTGHEAKKTTREIPYQRGVEREASSWIDWPAVAKMGTIVFLMGMGNVRANMKKLISHGKSPQTPVGVVRWAGTGKQRTLISTVENIADDIVKSNMKAPAVIVVGDVVLLSTQLNFLEKKSLHGQNILITRDDVANQSLAIKLLDLSAQVISLPLFDYRGVNEKSAQVKKIFLSVSEFDWLVFTSQTAVKFFMKQFYFFHDDLRPLMSVKIAAVGHKTAEEIKRQSLWVDLIAQDHTAQGLANEDIFTKSKKMKILLPAASDARQDFQTQHAQKHVITDLVLYEKKPIVYSQAFLKNILEKNIHWVLFYSPSAVELFVKNCGVKKAVSFLRKTKIAVIGKRTQEALENRGLAATVVSQESTEENLIEQISCF